MMVTLIRLSEFDGATLGMVLVRGFPTVCSLERPWKNNEKNISCIPVGNYKLKKVHSPKFGDTFEVCDVPNRSSILLHSGNTLKDTEGCILIGSDFDKIDGEAAIVYSKTAFQRFYDQLKDHEIVDLEIKSA